MVLPLNGFYFTFAREFRSPELCVHWRGARRWRARSRGAPPELCFFSLAGDGAGACCCPLAVFIPSSRANPTPAEFFPSGRGWGGGGREWNLLWPLSGADSIFAREPDPPS